MQKVQLQEHELLIGQPLPWSVFGPDDELLLNQGDTIASERQKYILLTRGLFREPTAEEFRQFNHIQKQSLTSPFNVLDAIRLNLRRILNELINEQNIHNFQHRIIKIARVIQKLCDENTDAALGAIILDQQSPYIQVHPVMCALLSELLLRRKNIPEQDRQLIIAAALTQNAGMLKLQDELSRQSSPLTETQQQAIRVHPTLSKEILINQGVNDKEWLTAVQNHHERPDGSGYPNALKGEDINLFSRVLSLSDIYSAMILPRQYRDGFYVKKALRDIFLQRGSLVDQNLAELLIKEMGIYPPGSFVKLANGDTAIVIQRGFRQANFPMVLTLLSPRGVRYRQPQRKNSQYQDRYGIKAIIPRPENLELDKHKIWGLGDK